MLYFLVDNNLFGNVLRNIRKQQQIHNDHLVKMYLIYLLYV
jgi:hypothetical protein